MNESNPAKSLIREAAEEYARTERISESSGLSSIVKHAFIRGASHVRKHAQAHVIHIGETYENFSYDAVDLDEIESLFRYEKLVSGGWLQTTEE